MIDDDATLDRFVEQRRRILDDACMFYPGRVHEIASEPDAGKSWLALLAAAQEIAMPTDGAA